MTSFPSRLATLAKSIALRQTHAGKPWKLPESNLDFTPTNEPPVQTYRTYDQTLDLLKRLKAAGVENVALCVAGWQNGGYDGRCPASFPIEEGPGGEAGLRRLCEGGRAHNLCLKHAWETLLPGELTKIRALGFEGCHYVDYINYVCAPAMTALRRWNRAVPAFARNGPKTFL